MRFEATYIPDVVKITPKRFGDERGYFSELFRDDLFRSNIGPVSFIQDNQSLSATPGTLRGLHFQISPSAQGKLVRCLTGAILDVAVDLRAGSPTFGKHVAVELTPDNGAWLWVPVGFAHGFCTLKSDTTVLYKVTGYYDAACDRGIRWNDPSLHIEWPFSEGELTLSAKDKAQPLLSEIGAPFKFQPTGA